MLVTALSVLVPMDIHVRYTDHIRCLLGILGVRDILTNWFRSHPISKLVSQSFRFQNWFRSRSDF